MKVRDLNIKDYTYVLPPERIAQQPLAERDASLLLIYRDGQLSHNVFRNLPDVLPAGSLLVFNDTKVIHARLLGRTPTGAQIEIFLLQPVAPYTDLQLAMFQHGSALWRCMVGNARRWRTGTLQISFQNNKTSGVLHLSRKGRLNGDYLVELQWTPADLSLSSVLEAVGHVPLPPYIKRSDQPVDRERYQSIFGHRDGSVASPTASLHFTERVMEQLKKNQIRSLFLTLHISAGTFLPVKSERLGDHRMHQEQVCVHRYFIEHMLQWLQGTSNPRPPLISVGTTSMRSLESLYWLGCRLLRGLPQEVAQWDPYDLDDSPTVHEALWALLRHMQQEEKNQLVFSTALLIAPGYRFKLVDALITNFHLPQSTLLLLVAAFVGDDWKRIYEYALAHDFRFLSYGDTSLLFAPRTSKSD
ncbi:MAG: S-adenosylmethionine:tRNA ribosyltransferase-isomerase [Chitinophagales bacterium]|nr:S-adenosylmethionine:tRNA ribosyltransferase-isomerase [Chitinophagales bacterium]MDW8427118.1 S-adenosylmethionine:tRNA ribosyltransferase-isomerase [Chitinophagales bacterium]